MLFSGCWQNYKKGAGKEKLKYDGCCLWALSFSPWAELLRSDP